MSEFVCSLSETMLSRGESACFPGFLERHGVDEALWDIYACALGVSGPATQPKVLRVHAGGRLAGAAFVVRCEAFGRSLFSSPWLHRPADWIGLTSFIWLRVGFCAEVLANPGFVADGFSEEAVVKAMIGHLCRHAHGVMITDWRVHGDLRAGAYAFPYVKDGAVDLRHMAAVADYLAEHRNIKRKVKHFTNKGGRIAVVQGVLDDTTRAALLHCLDTTVAASIITSPFQDIFRSLAEETCRCDSSKVVHFIARMGEDVLGYHSFVRSGRGLRMLHGAFDRSRRTTHHAYENLIIAAVDYALGERLERVHFGPILNETKRRMMNVSEESAIYFHSRFAALRFGFPAVFRRSRMQSRALLAFSGAPAAAAATQAAR